MRGEAGGRINVDSSDESTWESGGAKMPVDNHARGKGPPGVPDVLSGKGAPRRCPMEGCPGNLVTRSAMRLHFLHRHVLDTVVMLEEGNSPHPRCARCDMQVPRRALNGRHPGTALCEKGAERKRRRLVETETRENSDQAFEAYGAPIESVTEFRYLGRILTSTVDDWPAVVGNLRKAKQIWGRLANLIGR